MSDDNEDFRVVLMRARLKARGVEPTDEKVGRMIAGDAAATRKEREAAVPDITPIIERIRAKAKSGPRLHGEEPPPPEKPEPLFKNTAIGNRIAWYIPKRHVESTFDSYNPQNETQVAALKAVQQWVAAALQGRGPTLALTGAVGTGKSHLMYAAVRALNEADFNCGAWSWYDLADTLRTASFRDDELHTDALLEKHKLKGVDALCIDEIRPTSGTQFDGTHLGQLMTRAYDRMNPVLVTSNYAGRKLAAIIGQAAYDRLTPLQIVGESYRQKGAAA